jgi:hypothetical protein
VLIRQQPPSPRRVGLRARASKSSRPDHLAALRAGHADARRTQILAALGAVYPEP